MTGVATRFGWSRTPVCDQGAWEPGTWDGARREALRRSRRLSVRQRLEAMESLTETAEKLARIGWKGSGGGRSGDATTEGGDRDLPDRS